MTRSPAGNRKDEANMGELRCAVPAVGRSRADPPSSEGSKGSRVSEQDRPWVLIVDDEPESLDLLRRTLRSRWRVLAATSGPEGLGLLAAEPVTVVVADQRMPVMSGLAFLEQAARSFPHVQRILLTAYTEVEGLIEAINRAAVFGYVTKPWHPDELIRLVERAAEAHRLHQENRVLLRDLRERNRSLEALVAEMKRLEAEKMQAERWAALGRVASMLAHDLRNPLAAIQIHAGLLLEGELQEGLQARSARSILDEVGRMRRRIEDLLLVARPGPVPVEQARPYPVQALIGCLEESFRDRCRAQGIRLVCELGYKGSCVVRPGQIYRALENLLQNAIDAQPDGGDILIEAVAGEGGFVEIRVSDSGRGVPLEIADSLFEPFATHGKAGGTGLGLAVVKKIVEEHGGRVWQGRCRLRGACFHLTLPAVRAEKEAHEQSAQ